jgi:hypothetical protein
MLPDARDEFSAPASAFAEQPPHCGSALVMWRRTELRACLDGRDCAGATLVFVAPMPCRLLIGAALAVPPTSHYPAGGGQRRWWRACFSVRFPFLNAAIVQQDGPVAAIRRT